MEDLDTEFGLTKKIHGINTQLDDAVRLLAEAGGSNSKSPRRRWKRVLRKIDLGVCVTMCIIYCIQSLDRSDLTYAVFDLQTGYEPHGSQYTWLSS